jgi:hypothetical protein
MTPEAVSDLVVSCAPELAGLYVVFASHTNAELAQMDGGEVEGCTTPNMDRRLGRFINPWRGRRPCMLLADRRLHEEAAQLAGPGFPLAEAERWVFGAVALHEAGHILERHTPYWGGADGPGDYPADLLQEMAKWILTPEKDLPPPPSPQPWCGHGPTWLRLVGHLAWRARKKGLYLSTPAVVRRPGYYGLGNPQCFEWALGDELERCAELPFKDILNQSPPEAYFALWGDVEAEWHLEHDPALAALRKALQRPTP